MCTTELNLNSLPIVIKEEKNLLIKYSYSSVNSNADLIFY